MEKTSTTAPAVPGVVANSEARRGSSPSLMRSAHPPRKPAIEKSKTAARTDAGDSEAKGSRLCGFSRFMRGLIVMPDLIRQMDSICHAGLDPESTAVLESLGLRDRPAM